MDALYHDDVELAICCSMAVKLSIIVLVQKKETNSLRTQRAVESARFADEVLVVPQPAQIQDFSKARNDATKQAKGDWVMFLDSDEIISEDLALEIKSQISRLQAPEGPATGGQAKLKTNHVDGFYMKRKDRFFGTWLRYGETVHVKLLRLARKDAGTWIRPVHEIWKIEGKIGELKHPLLHYSHVSVDQILDKINLYSDLESSYRNEKMYYNPSGRKHYNIFLSLQLLIFPFGKFVQNYFMRLGFLDGIPGFINASMMSFHSYLVRAKILSQLEMRKNQRVSE